MTALLLTGWAALVVADLIDWLLSPALGDGDPNSAGPISDAFARTVRDGLLLALILR